MLAPPPPEEAVVHQPGLDAEAVDRGEVCLDEALLRRGALGAGELCLDSPGTVSAFLCIIYGEKLRCGLTWHHFRSMPRLLLEAPGEGWRRIAAEPLAAARGKRPDASREGREGSEPDATAERSRGVAKSRAQARPQDHGSSRWYYWQCPKWPGIRDSPESLRSHEGAPCMAHN